MDKRLFRTVLSIIAICVLLVLIVANISAVIDGIRSFFRLLFPVFLGLCIAFVLNKPYTFFLNTFKKLFSKSMSRVQRIGFKLAKPIALILVYLLFIAILTLLIILVIPQLLESISDLYGNVDNYVSNVTALLKKAEETFGLDISILSELEAYLTGIVQRLPEIISAIIPGLFRMTQSLASSLTNSLLGFAMSIYLLAGKEFLTTQVKRFVYAYFPKKAADKSSKIMALTSQTFGSFVSGQLIDAVIVGMLCFIGMSIFGFDYAFLISIVIGLTNIIPILGPFIGAIPSVFLLFIIDPKQAIFFALFILILQQIDGNIIAPRIIGDSIGLPSILVLIAITVGGGLFGIFGMIIGVPLCAVIYKIIKNETQKKENKIKNA